MTLHLAGAVVGAVVGAASSIVIPPMVARIPDEEPLEPQAEGEPEDEAHRILREEGPLVPFKDLAAGRWLLPGVVIASAIVAGLIGARVGLTPVLVLLLVLVPAGVALAFVDWRTRLLPTAVVAPLYGVAVAGVLVLWLIDRHTDDLIRAGLGWLIYGGACFVLWFVYPPGLGYGDVRLAGVLGIVLGYLGWAELFVGAVGGFMIGGVAAPLLVLARLAHRRGVPMGPFLLLGALVAVLAGPAVSTGLGY